MLRYICCFLSFWILWLILYEVGDGNSHINMCVWCNIRQLCMSPLDSHDSCGISVAVATVNSWFKTLAGTSSRSWGTPEPKRWAQDEKLSQSHDVLVLWKKDRRHVPHPTDAIVSYSVFLSLILTSPSFSLQTADDDSVEFGFFPQGSFTNHCPPCSLRGTQLVLFFLNFFVQASMDVIYLYTNWN